MVFYTLGMYGNLRDMMIYHHTLYAYGIRFTLHHKLPIYGAVLTYETEDKLTHSSTPSYIYATAEHAIILYATLMGYLSRCLPSLSPTLNLIESQAALCVCPCRTASTVQHGGIIAETINGTVYWVFPGGSILPTQFNRYVCAWISHQIIALCGI